MHTSSYVLNPIQPRAPQPKPSEPFPRENMDCRKRADNGQSYRGHVAHTVHGQRCINWASLHPRNKFNPRNMPQARLDDNYCRNPGECLFLVFYF